LKNEQKKIKAYNGPHAQWLTTQASDSKGSSVGGKTLKPIHFQLPKSVTNGIMV
jgi:hypothetical protein